MSLDLFERETAERLATMKTVQVAPPDPEPEAPADIAIAFGALIVALLAVAFLPRLLKRCRRS